MTIACIKDYIYYYENGMIALDKIGYGSALYIMPAHIYKEVRNKKNLFEVRTVPGVRFIVHKNDNWLLSARDYIENGTKGLTENDIRDSELIASIDFPYTISGLEKLKQELELEGKYSGKIQNEIERRESKAKSLLEIDDELRSDIEDDAISFSNEEFNNYQLLDKNVKNRIEKKNSQMEEVSQQKELIKQQENLSEYNPINLEICYVAKVVQI